MSMDETRALLAEIQAFLNRTGMKPSYFGKQAAGNSEIVARLEAGGTVTLRTAERIRKFINNHSSPP
jgi:hypothetical protein